MIDKEHGAKVIAVACGAAVLTLGGLFLLSGGKGTGAAAGTGTEAAGTETAGTETAGTETAGAETDGTETAGAETQAGAGEGQDQQAAEQSQESQSDQGPVGYEERDIPLFRTQLTEETIPVRFYDDLPSIAYVKIEDYHHLFLPEDQVTVEETADGTGVYNVANSGGSAVIDTVQETIKSDDLLAFVNVMGMLQPGIPNTYLDGMAYCRWARREISPAQTPVELDFAEYGIDLRADESGLYLPAATLSDLYADLAYHFAFYCNGKFYVEDENKETPYIFRDDEFLEQYMAVDPIPEDLAAFNYGELCFAVDTFYGLPERVELDDSIREKGLDRTLEEYGEDGVKIRELLRSTEKGEYLYGLDCIGGLLADGGHTAIGARDYADAMPQAMYDKYMEVKSTGFTRDKTETGTKEVIKFYNNIAVKKKLRDAAYGEGVTYVKKGNTAVCIFDSFGDTYFDAVEAYINGEADELPQDDPMRIFKEALDQAKADPEVENFIVDITNNGGGSLDILAAMAAMLTGENEIGITFTNTLTGQTVTDYYQIDCNLDGKFDDADKIPCDLRIGVETSSCSFSCGNMFPSIMKEKGAMILGEQSGGGCCAIQNMVMADGFYYRFSSGRMHLTTGDGGQIDFGVPVDADLVEKNEDGSNKMMSTPMVGLAIEEDGSINNEKEMNWESVDYSQFYNLDRLGEEMDSFFGEEALQPAA